MREQQILQLEWVGPLLLCEEEVDRIPPYVAGVYLLHAFDARSGAYPPFYVGSSFDLRRRLHDHLGRRAKPAVQAVRMLERTYFSATPVGLPLLLCVEAGLILMLRPICNGSMPKAKPVFVNLPPMTLMD